MTGYKCLLTDETFPGANLGATIATVEAEEIPESPAALGEWLSALAEERGYSNGQLARMVGTSKTNIARWLSGQHEPGALMMLSLFAALAVRVSPEPPDSIPLTVNAEFRDLNRQLAELREEQRVSDRMWAELVESGALPTKEELLAGQTAPDLLARLEAKVSELPTAEDLERGLRALREAIDAQASSGSDGDAREAEDGLR